jgi:mannose-6-phosphate isomerase-like protein (cupin superfamily)
MPTEPLVLKINAADEYQPLLRGRPVTCGMRSGRVFLKPGESCGRHSTEAHEEQLVFLAGRGTAHCGDPTQNLEVGERSILYVPPHTPHDIQNTGSEPLVYIYCVAPVADAQAEAPDP